MTKITADHLARGAFIYVRQSTADQLVHNQESLRASTALLVARKSSAGYRRGCWRRSARGALGPYSRSKPPGSAATAAIGIR
jgi:hypothetical protein